MNQIFLLQIQQIFFNDSKEPLPVKAGENIGICVRYPEFDESSKLIVGDHGEEYEKIEDNEKELFKVSSHSDSGNGTDVNAGQIPELYYVK